MKKQALTVTLVAVLTVLVIAGCTQSLWLAFVAAVPGVVVAMKVAIAIQTISEKNEETVETVFVTPGEETVEATFESLRWSLKMQKDFFNKKDYFRSALASKQAARIADEMIEKADESVRYSVERHIEDIMLGKC